MRPDLTLWPGEGAREPSDNLGPERFNTRRIAGVTSDPNARYPPHVVPERAERLQ